MSIKKLIVVAVALTGTLGAGLAQARGNDVQWSVTIGAPVGLPLPPLPVFGVPYPVYGPSANVGYHRHPQPVRSDRDRDGIPDRYDRVYNPRWDRDGDGVPNRYDRVDNRRYDRDGRDGRDGRGWHR